MNNRFCFIAPMYNATATLSQCIASLVGQSYSNWRLILIDDMSDEPHKIHQNEIINTWRDMTNPGWRGMNLREPRQTKIDVIWNKEKKWEVANVLEGISMCENNDIVARIDADDWLTDLDCLAYLDQFYNRHATDVVWSAHRWGYSDKNISGPMPQLADPYTHQWVSSHLKTFRKHLINNINDLNFRGEDGNYVRRAGDQAIYLPILKNSLKRTYVPRVFYHYTINDVPETYQTDDARFQRDEAVFLRARGYIK